MFKFKIGDKIKHPKHEEILTIKEISYVNNSYWYEFEETEISLNVNDNEYILVVANQE